jgi:hypothetical protein
MGVWSCEAGDVNGGGGYFLLTSKGSWFPQTASHRVMILTI